MLVIPLSRYHIVLRVTPSTVVRFRYQKGDVLKEYDRYIINNYQVLLYSIPS